MTGAGALLGFAALILVARRAAPGSGSMLLGGIALGSLSNACVTLIMTHGGMEATVILNWLTGSTAQADPILATVALAASLLIAGTLAALARWLDLLQLGGQTARALGLPLARSRLVLLVVTALAAGISTLLIGPVSFVGLMAPHLARAAGFRAARQHLTGSIAIGATLMAAADVLSRLAFHPYQMPVGLFASLVGAPYLAWSATRRSGA